MNKLYQPTGAAWLYRRGGSLRVPRPPGCVRLSHAQALSAFVGCVLEASAIGLDPAGPAEHEDAVRRSC